MKKMEIIMLTGKPNKGKTASLTFVHEILVAYGAETTLVERIGAEDQRDFSSVLIYKKRKKIRIFTMGDVKYKECREKLREALEEKIYDFLICACNDGHSEFTDKATKPLIEKTVAKTNVSRLAANWYDASRIIELLDETIEKRKKA